MIEGEIVSSNSKGPDRELRSLPQAYWHFLADRHESRALKLMPLALLGIIPFSIVDDFLLPFFGIADDLPTIIIVLIVIIWTYLRVRHHR